MASGALVRSAISRGSVWRLREVTKMRSAIEIASRRQMTPEQIAEAQRLASEWKPKLER